MAGNRNGEDYDAGGDFKRRKGNTTGESGEEHPGVKKVQEYIRTLIAEKTALDAQDHPLASKLLEQEITRAQTQGRGPKRDQKFVDIYRERPANVNVKVLVPLDQYPKFNFVGKILGPKGNTLKRLQEETMCRMAVLGRGSMKDREKEEELRKSTDVKYSHLVDNLHVDISALAPPAEAYARVAFALAEVRKYITPDGSDDISKGQLQEMGLYEERPPRPKGRPGPPGGTFQHPGMKGSPPSRASGPPRLANRIQGGNPRGGPAHDLRGMPGSGPRGMPGSGPRGLPGKPSIMSLLDRNRSSRDDNYGMDYEEPYEQEPPQYNNYSSSGSSRPGFGGNRFGSSDYDAAPYGNDSNNYSDNQQWKPYKTGPGQRSENQRFRSAPYSRSGNRM